MTKNFKAGMHVFGRLLFGSMRVRSPSPFIVQMSYIYIMIPGKIDLTIIFLSSFMVGFSFSDLVAGWSSVQHLSWTLACPVHCSPSCGPWFLAGLCLGSLLSFFAVGFAVFGLRHLVFGLSFGGSPPSFPSRAAARHRLQAYLHE